MPKPLASGGNVTSAFLNDLVGVYDRSTTEVDVVSTTTEVTLYSKSVTGGHMASDRMLRCTILGDILYNQNVQLHTRIKLGATTLYADDFRPPGVSLSAIRFAYVLQFQVANRGATNVQFMSGTFVLSARGDVAGPPLSGIGAMDQVAGAAVAFATDGNAAVDTTVAQTLAVTVQPDTSTSAVSFRKKYALLELL